MDFEKIRKKCPWFYIGTNLDRSKRCLATDTKPKLDITASGWGKDCCRKNCAIYFWIKEERKFQKSEYKFTQ